jgi:hypothetical protein
MSGNGCGQDKKKKDGAPKGAPSLEKSELLPGLVTTVAAIAATTETTAVATATAAATAAETTAAAASARALSLRTRFVDVQLTTVDIDAVHFRDGCFSFGVCRHFDETETFAATAVAIHHDTS